MAEVGSLFISLGHFEHLEVTDRYEQNIWITGPGRSKFLHAILTGLPAEVTIWLYDIGVNTFAHKAAQDRYVFSGYEAGLRMFETLELEIDYRLKTLINSGKMSFYAYCQEKGFPPFPRIVVVVDFFDQLLRDLVGKNPVYIRKLEQLIQFASVCGITLVVSGDESSLLMLLPISFTRCFGTCITVE